MLNQALPVNLTSNFDSPQCFSKKKKEPIEMTQRSVLPKKSPPCSPKMKILGSKPVDLGAQSESMQSGLSPKPSPKPPPSLGQGYPDSSQSASEFLDFLSNILLSDKCKSLCQSHRHLTEDKTCPLSPLTLTSTPQELSSPGYSIISSDLGKLFSGAPWPCNLCSKSVHRCIFL
jgi:hypothetical protein